MTWTTPVIGIIKEDGLQNEAQALPGVDYDTAGAGSGAVVSHESAYNHALLHTQNTDTIIQKSVPLPIDETGKTLGVNGSINQIIVNPKFGNGAMLLTSGFLSASNSADFAFGTGDFTIDLWWRHTGSSAVQSLVSKYVMSADDTAFDFFIDQTNNKLGFKVTTGATPVADYIMTNTLSYSFGDWHHFELCRNGAVVHIFVDGIDEALTVNTAIGVATLPAMVSDTYIGYGPSGQMHSVMDELRVSKGIARHTSGFTPPTAEYTVDSYTKLLVHYDTLRNLISGGELKEDLAVLGGKKIDGRDIGNDGAIVDQVATVSGIVKGNGDGTFSAAGSGTDYLAPAGDGASLTNVVHSETDPVVGAIAGIVKANGAGAISAAVANTDYLPSTASVISKAGTSSVASTDSGKIVYNSAAADISLPTGASGLNYEFVVNNASYLKIIATNSETIRYLENASAANGYIRSQTVGNTVKLVFTNGVWYCTGLQAKAATPWTMDA